MKIYCNWQPRELVAITDIPHKHLPQFDYIEPEQELDYRFVFYRGQWHDAHDTQQIVVGPSTSPPMGWAMRVHPTSKLAEFHAIISESFFSGVLFKFLPDNKVIVAHYME